METMLIIDRFYSCNGFSKYYTRGWENSHPSHKNIIGGPKTYILRSKAKRQKIRVIIFLNSELLGNTALINYHHLKEFNFIDIIIHFIINIITTLL